MTPANNYIPQLPIFVNNEMRQPSGSEVKGTTPSHNFEGMLPALPPSFSSLLMDCSQNNLGLWAFLFWPNICSDFYHNLFHLNKIIHCSSANFFGGYWAQIPNCGTYFLILAKILLVDALINTITFIWCSLQFKFALRCKYFEGATSLPLTWCFFISLM